MPTPFAEALRNSRIVSVLALGFSSGLPLALTGSTLQAWMTDAQVDIRTIGIFSLVGLPYTLKFLWSPWMDRYAPPFLDRRRGWILMMQGLLMILIALMGSFSPRYALPALAAMSVAVAAASASQDIAIDAYRNDLLRTPERGLGAAASVFGYRMAMFTSGAFALILSDTFNWQYTYWTMAALLGLSMGVTWISPRLDREKAAPTSLNDAVIGPLKDFFSRRHATALLILIVLYKIGDAFAGALTTRFLLSGTDTVPGMGFSKTDVGVINKGFGLVATLAGAWLGGFWMVRLKLPLALLIFGTLQALSNLTFMQIALSERSYTLLIYAISIENITGGMGTVASVALLMALCNRRFSATQFALLSALSAVGRVWVGPLSGYGVVALGWPVFFFVTFLTALPGLGLIFWLRHAIADAALTTNT